MGIDSEHSKQKYKKLEDTSNEKFIDIYQNKFIQTLSEIKSNYDIAAYRTLVTACELTPDFYFTVVQDLLKFDYSKIIKWALEYGIYDDKVSSFLIPFEKWLIQHDQ